jgi:hypothetical protein
MSGPFFFDIEQVAPRAIAFIDEEALHSANRGIVAARMGFHHFVFVAPMFPGSNIKVDFSL